MKTITILTLFPKQVNDYLNYSILKRAIEKKIIKINVIDFRKFSSNKHKKVDDYQYGGGPGMIIGLQAIVAAIKKYKNKKTKIFLLTPQSKTIFNQNVANKMAKSSYNFILICGHYEGFDARIKYYIDGTISIGDYILTGGEIASIVIVDAITRLLDKAINKSSLISESFSNYLLDYDSYTKPVDFEGHKVPSVLLNGNHQMIEQYRLKNRIQKTKLIRPDLYDKIKSNKS